MTEGVEIARLPIHERLPKMDGWHAKAKASTNPVLRQLTPALDRIHRADCANQAMLVPPSSPWHASVIGARIKTAGPVVARPS